MCFRFALDVDLCCSLGDALTRTFAIAKLASLQKSRDAAAGMGTSSSDRLTSRQSAPPPQLKTCPAA